MRLRTTAIGSLTVIHEAAQSTLDQALIIRFVAVFHAGAAAAVLAGLLTSWTGAGGLR